MSAIRLDTDFRSLEFRGPLLALVASVSRETGLPIAESVTFFRPPPSIDSTSFDATAEAGML